ncbi:hypothetical protein BST42_09630 [Mycolicibacterium rhodesiae]|uniref:Uncharacterized protein n=1 Tax=Mycolicibacterium rhodesiae TaxID=36814 RepID=A0A1X0J1C5_MYCRH|nr:hypothetical protein [Mycolicibacterium rhodesiae]MCV7345413.1 hypothetical protein [Mycolicibacterium rhodesiae]ORB55023.1 hypothetical protein BST42_09630 [Mycolicibacterium rhodesiae]
MTTNLSATLKAAAKAGIETTTKLSTTLKASTGTNTAAKARTQADARVTTNLSATLKATTKPGIETTAKLSTTLKATTGAKAGPETAAQTNPSLATDFGAAANRGTKAGVEARLDLNVQPGLEPGADSGTQSGLQTAAGIESAAKAGTQAEAGLHSTTDCSTEAEAGLDTSAERGTEARPEALAQADTESVTDRGGQIRATVDSKIQCLVGDNAGRCPGGRKESFDRREAVLVGKSLSQAGHRVRADELEAGDCGRGDRLNLLGADVGQPRVRQRRIRVGYIRLRCRLVVEQVKDELKQGVHWTFLPSLLGKLDRRPRPVITSHGMEMTRTPKWGAVPYPIRVVPGYPSNPG